MPVMLWQTHRVSLLMIDDWLRLILQDPNQAGMGLRGLFDTEAQNVVQVLSQLAEVELQGRLREQRGWLEVKSWRTLRSAVAVLLLSSQREGWRHGGTGSERFRAGGGWRLQKMEAEELQLSGKPHPASAEQLWKHNSTERTKAATPKTHSDNSSICTEHVKFACLTITHKHMGWLQSMSFCLGYIGDINKGHSDLKTDSFCVILVSVLNRS